MQVKPPPVNSQINLQSLYDQKQQLSVPLGESDAVVENKNCL